MKSILLTICVFLFGIGVHSQELPPVQNFGKIDYNGGNQNWSITQDDEKHLYFGNNNGLLEFNGSVWNIYPSPNGTIIRAVFEKDGLIYSGCYMEFGYWKRNEFGQLVYQSLIEKLTVPLIDDEHVWNITSRDQWVLFQTLDRLYIYSTIDESFQVVDFKVSRAKLFNLKDKLYIQKGDGGLYSIQNGKPVLESDHSVLLNNFIVGLYEQGGKLLLLAEDGSFYFLDNETVSPWRLKYLNGTKELSVYSSQRLRDGSFVLGTISDGYIRLNENGVLLEKMNQEDGLANNTVLAAFQDIDDNLWLGLDNGISNINLESVFKVYTDAKGEIGAVYASLEHEGILYLGSNQGLFARKLASNDGFKMLKGTSGQVWNLKVLDNSLFCSHNDGTFVVEGFVAKNVFSDSGTWEVKTVPDNSNFLLQGNYNGFSVLEKRNQGWTFRNTIDGFDISSKSFEFIGPGKIVMNHEHNGVHVITLDTEYQTVQEVKVLSRVGINSQVFRYKDRIYYSSDQGVFTFDTSASVLQKDSVLTSLFYDPTDPVSGKLLVEPAGEHIWGFSANNLISLSPDSFDGSPKKMNLSIPTFFRRNQGVLGYENMSILSNGSYLIGASNGYSLLDLDKNREKEYSISVNSFLLKFLHDDNEYMNIGDGLEFGHDQNSFVINYSIPEFDNYAEVEYQYRLIGLDDQWSKWFTEPYVSLENLRFGDYSFEVRGRVGNTMTQNTASIDFKVNRPWYLSIIAIILYVLTILLTMFLINRLFIRYYRKQRSRLIEENEKQLELTRLEGEQEIMKLRNNQLRSELESKNRELATTAMSLINKNELLQGIKTDLLQLEDAASRKEVARVIDKNLSNNNDWEFFKEAFNNADKDFLNKIKKQHPDLTANDLKFCAFLRLNLSSKEIAPLLNISVRSVEIKRYRLRKKLKLNHSDNLIDHILAI